MPPAALPANAPKPLDPAKFKDPTRTKDGQKRAQVALTRLETLWFNTGTLCNLTCTNCYIESTPRNDRLAYLTLADVRRFLDELDAASGRPIEIGFTGGEPFLNPDFLAMLEVTLARGHRLMVLSNAMRPMMRATERLAALEPGFRERLTFRISLDHYSADLHALERGPAAWKPAIQGLQWLTRQGFKIHVAGRTRWGESEAQLRAGYGRLFAALALPIDASDPVSLVLFPEMDERLDVPEITESCWGILHKNPDAMMCATSRMVVRRKGEAEAVVLACTLIAYDPRFEMGRTLAEAARPIALNHPHCARFCVLGGGACSRPA
jgi:hypothetical protein